MTISSARQKCAQKIYKRKNREEVTKQLQASMNSPKRVRLIASIWNLELDTPVKYLKKSDRYREKTA